MDTMQLTTVYDGAAPYATVYLPLEAGEPDAATRLDTTWSDVARDLRAAGIAAPVADAMGEARGQHGSGGTRLLVADASGLRYAQTYRAGRDDTVVRTGDLPHLLPLLAFAQGRLPYVLVLTDRAGADIVAFADGPSAGGSQSAGSGTVGTDAYPLHKTNPGGMGTYRFEHGVEQDWKTNAKAVAEQVALAAEQVSARIVFVGGDVHAVGLLEEALPAAVAAEVRQVRGSRHPDGSTDETQREVADAVAATVLTELDGLLEQLETYRGRAEKTDAAGQVPILGADGVAATVQALQRAQIETLLLSDALGGEDGAPLVFGAEGTALALTPHDLSEAGSDPRGSAPLADVLVRAALLTGARVRVVPATHPGCPPDGVGALLRFPAAP